MSIKKKGDSHFAQDEPPQLNGGKNEKNREKLNYFFYSIISSLNVKF